MCTWNAAHAECAIAALNAGKHVLCEKPMAMNADEAHRMQEAAEKNGKLLMIGFVRRFGNDCAILKDFIDNGYFGDILLCKGDLPAPQGLPGRLVRRQDPFRRRPADRSGRAYSSTCAVT